MIIYACKYVNNGQEEGKRRQEYLLRFFSLAFAYRMINDPVILT